MQRRTLTILIGENWFVSHVCDLFDRITSKYTSTTQPRGLLSLFPISREIQYSTRATQESVEGLHEYCKDEQSQRAFSEPVSKNTEIKVYIAGHGFSGCKTLASIHASKKLRFRIKVQAIANRLDQLFRQVEVNPCSACPIKLSLIVCAAAAGGDDAFAVRLLRELHALGYNHILIKAYAKKVLAPFFGNKLTNGEKVHFYLENDVIYTVNKEDDLRKQVLKVLKKRYVTQGDFFDECIQQINEISLAALDQREMLSEILLRAIEHSGDRDLIRLSRQLQSSLPGALLHGRIQDDSNRPNMH